MKPLKLLICGCRTANAKGDPSKGPAAADDIQVQLDALKAQNAELSAKLEAINNPPAAKSKLNIGPFSLPPGISEDDVLWRMQAGLDAKQAVQAALQQKNHDDATAQAKVPAPAKATTKPD